MIINNVLRGAIIDTVELYLGEEASDEWMAYKLVIKTNCGILQFEGNHDSSGEIEIEKI